MRVHYKGSSTFCCNSDAPCAEHAEKYPPAQSDAPSAEDFLISRGYPFGAQQGLVTVMEAYAALRTELADEQLKLTRVELKQSCEERERLLATERAKVAQLEKDVAALAQVVKDYERINATLHEEIVSQINQVGIAENRVAQLERERDALRDEGIRWCVQGGTVVMVEKFDALKLRAETAEAALSEARERAQKLEEIIQRVLDQLPQAIYGCRGCGGSGVTTGTEHHPDCEGGCRLCPIEVQVQCECEGKSVDVEGLLTELRALASGRVRCGG